MGPRQPQSGCPRPCKANAPLYPLRVHPQCPRAPRTATATSSLSSAHRGSILRWENFNNLNQNTKRTRAQNLRMVSGRYPRKLPGQTRRRGTQTKPWLVPPCDPTLPCGPLRASAWAVPQSSPPLAEGGPAVTRPGGWVSSCRPDSVCALLSTLAAGLCPSQ